MDIGHICLTHRASSTNHKAKVYLRSNADSHYQDVSVTATFTLAEESARPDQPLGAASGVMLMTPTPVMTPGSVSTEPPTPGHVSPVRTMVSNT